MAKTKQAEQDEKDQADIDAAYARALKKHVMGPKPVHLSLEQWRRLDTESPNHL